MIDQKDSIILIEWPEKILDKLPKETRKVTIKKSGEQERLLVVD